MPSSWRRRRDRAGLAVGTMLLLLAGVGVVQGGDRTGFTAAGTVPSTPASVAAAAPVATAPAAPAAAAPPPPAPRRREPPRPAPAPRRTGIAAQGIRPDASFAPDRVRVAALGVDARGRPQRRSTAGARCPCRRTRAPSAGGVPAPHPGHRWARSCWPATSTASSRAPARSTRWRGRRSAPGSSSAAPAARRRTSCRAGAAIAKDALPWRDLFRQDVEARLLLVTCGGDFDRGTRHYSDNVVVYAVPLGAASPSSPR